MADHNLVVELTAPNGLKYQQPTGLFINNEFVKSKSGEKITTINPSFALHSWSPSYLTRLTPIFPAMKPRSPLSTPLRPPMLTLRSPLRAQPSNHLHGVTYPQVNGAAFS